MQQELLAANVNQYLILQADESIFSPNTYRLRKWAKRGRPLQTVSKYQPNQRKVAVLGFISAVGYVHFERRVRSFKSADVCAALQKVRNVYGAE